MHLANEQRLLVIAMGKMGAYELNISSDIDLIFAYPEAGQTVGGTRSIDNQAFFIRLGQKLIAALDKHSGRGLCLSGGYAPAPLWSEWPPGNELRFP